MFCITRPSGTCLLLPSILVLVANELDRPATSSGEFMKPAHASTAASSKTATAVLFVMVMVGQPASVVWFGGWWDFVW